MQSPGVLSEVPEETNVLVLLVWGWTELPYSHVTNRTEYELWRENISPKQIQEIDLIERYLPWGALRSPEIWKQVQKKNKTQYSSQAPRRASAREDPQYSYLHL